MQHGRLLQEIVPYSTKCGFIVNKLFISKKIDHSLTSSMVLDLFELNFFVSPSAGSAISVPFCIPTEVSGLNLSIYSIDTLFAIILSCISYVLSLFWSDFTRFAAYLLRYCDGIWGRFMLGLILRATWTATSRNRPLFD